MPEISAMYSAIVSRQKRNSLGFECTFTGIRLNTSCSPCPEQTQHKFFLLLFMFVSMGADVRVCSLQFYLLVLPFVPLYEHQKNAARKPK